MPQHNIDFTWSRGSNSTDQTLQRVSKTADSEIIIGDADSPLTVADEAADAQVDVAIDVSQLKSLYIKSDRALTIETNDGSTPDDTLTLVANEPLVWWTGCGWSCPLTTDVTGMFLSNASGGDATVQMRFLVDATP